jgi:hypothetical protein
MWEKSIQLNGVMNREFFCHSSLSQM